MGDAGGMLARLTTAVYQYLILQLYLLLTCSPTIIVWTLLAPDPSNTVLFVAALLPIGPAMAGALYGLREWTRTPDSSPAGPLFRGYRANLIDTLKWWVVVLVVTALLAVNVVLAPVVPGGSVIRPVCLALLVGLGVLTAHLLVATSYFSFRARDVIRVAALEVFAQWKASLGFLGLLLMAAAIVAISSEAVLLLLGWAFAGLLRLASRPVEEDITDRFTLPPEVTADDPAPQA
jgi:hypothetical protein